MSFTPVLLRKRRACRAAFSKQTPPLPLQPLPQGHQSYSQRPIKWDTNEIQNETLVPFSKPFLKSSTRPVTPPLLFPLSCPQQEELRHVCRHSMSQQGRGVELFFVCGWPAKQRAVSVPANHFLCAALEPLTTAHQQALKYLQKHWPPLLISERGNR